MGVLRPINQPRRTLLLRPSPRRRRPAPPSTTRPGQPPRRHPPRLPTTPHHLQRTQDLGTPPNHPRHPSRLTTYDPGMSIGVEKLLADQLVHLGSPLMVDT